MAAFIPFAGNNSIVEVAFALQFGQSLASVIAPSFDSLKSDFIEEFPKFDSARRLQLTFGMQTWSPETQPQRVSDISGFSGVKSKSDGNPSRVIQAMENLLSVHFLEYEHWDETKAQALRWFERCFAILRAPNELIPLVAINLRFIDRFTYDGNSDEASASQLFRANTRFVPQQIFDVGNAWHSNSGWFEMSNNGNKSLHQLNAQGMVDDSAAVVINHNVQCTLQNPWSLTSSETTTIEKVFDAEHDSNASILRNLLGDDVLKAIGLKS